MSLSKVRNILHGTGLPMPSKWTSQQNAQWSRQVDIILQAAAELEVEDTHSGVQQQQQSIERKRKRKRKNASANRAIRKKDTDNQPKRIRPARQAKIQAISKLRQFSIGSSNNNMADGKFEGVSYPTRAGTSLVFPQLITHNKKLSKKKKRKMTINIL